MMLWDSPLHHDRLGPQDNVLILKLRDIFGAMEIDTLNAVFQHGRTFVSAAILNS